MNVNDALDIKITEDNKSFIDLVHHLNKEVSVFNKRNVNLNKDDYFPVSGNRINIEKIKLLTSELDHCLHLIECECFASK